MGIYSSKCTSTARLDGKTAIVTGCNTGIGKETVRDFYRRGARVVMACRNTEKAEEAANEIAASYENSPNLGEIAITQLDLTSLQSVRKCAKKILQKEVRIDLLVNNAGVMACPYSQTKDGFEMQFGTNHLGHFLFTLLLLPKIVHSTPARIINLSSLVHQVGTIDFEDINWERKSYSAAQAYSQSKLANILFSNELASKIEEKGIKGLTVYSIHPGVVSTDLQRHLGDTYFKALDPIIDGMRGWYKTPVEGAQTTIYCAVDEQAGEETGLYYVDCKVVDTASNAKKEDVAKKLWNVSLKMVGLDINYNPFEVVAS